MVDYVLKGFNCYNKIYKVLSINPKLYNKG